MSLESVRAFLSQRAPDIEILETPASSATVAEAAAAFGVAPGQIAKTLSLRVGERKFLVIARGDVRLDNRKVKERFGGRVSMLDAADVEAMTGHPIGGVCPFGLATNIPVYCDISLKAFDVVMPAAGSRNSALRISPDRLATLVGAEWVDVCSAPATARI